MARVLIVEPEPDLRQLAQDAIRELGHEAILHDGGTPAADVLLLAAFTGMGALVKEMRAGGSDLPVVCTGTMPPSAEARAIHPAAYLVKPYSLTTLEKALRQALVTSVTQ